jgi:hypothetical protein
VANTLVSINSNDNSVSRAFELQVRGFLDYLRNELRQRIDCDAELQDHEIQEHLQKIASDALDYYQLRWRLLDYLAFFDHEPDGLQSKHLLENFILLLELAMRGSIPRDNPKLSKSVKTLFNGKFPWAPLDIFRTVNRDIPNLADSGGYEERVRQGTYLVLQVDTQQIFVQFGLVNVPPKKAQSTFTGELTASQREAYQSLAHFLDLRLNPRTAGGIQPRPHALIVGPSGVGKTALVRAFAEDLTGERGFRCPTFFTDCGTFIPDGAKAEPWTLRAIQRWARSEVAETPAGVLFIDEADKLWGEHDWSRSIVQNVFALLDNRLGSLAYWSEEDSRLLEQKILIIGAGTWQKVQKESLSDPGNVSRRGARMDRIEAASAIPEELLFRFSADVIFLDPMIETEIQERIAQIHRDLNEPVKASKLGELAHRCASSNRQMRWLEAYVSRLLRRQFLADRTAEEAHDDPELGLN